ncbi:MAG: glycosyltransferase family 1 protein [Polyangiaceae bacterium]|nr:glycosyltransferase family 1 protein [Polyangiaceae bacterium]
MRFALAPHGTRGDVHPMIALGERLCADGHEVVLCAPPDFQPAAARAGLELRPIGRPIEVLLGEGAADWAGGPLRAFRVFNETLREALGAQLAELPRAVAGADLVVGAGLQVGAPTVAELAGKPYRYFAYCPAMLESRHHAPALLPLAGLPPWTYGLAWRLVRASYNGWLRRAIEAGRRRVGLGPIGDVYEHVFTRAPLLACDADLAPAPDDCRPRPIVTGYLEPRDDAALSAEVEHFLGAGAPPVYVGFGSMPDGDPGRTTRAIVTALAALGRRAILHRGGAGLGQGQLPATVLAVGALPHGKLFPRVAAVVHHGGAGTTATAARAGVPQLVVPHIAEQHYWAGATRRLGVGGPPLPRTSLDARRLTEALGSVLDDRGAVARARALAARLARHDPASRAAELLVAAARAGR